ncbi:hypothetical protein SsS58_03998 [Streptomyces scabiei]|uniref:Uncharacterized protein n=1 Tax=Streptomyces scabiei TaxID=1930 RepID=A0A100JQ31_STRSC|nr:hypothetical protein SsS58_03998 [Streptomyces scabiei]
MNLGGRALNEPTDDRVRTISLHDLIQPLGWRGLCPVRRCRHVAVQQRVDQVGALQLELAFKFLAKSALLRFQQGAGVMGHKANDPFVRTFLISEEPRTVQGMEARGRDGRRVADVMQHGGGFQQLGVVSQNRAQGASALGDPERVCPPAREWIGKQ